MVEVFTTVLKMRSKSTPYFWVYIAVRHEASLELVYAAILQSLDVEHVQLIAGIKKVSH